jgi:Tfp pilus assembly protein PilF
LEVHAWPIVLVIDRDGLELARVSDSSPMLRERLQSYLTGVGPRKIAAAVTQPTTTPSTTRAARLLRLAEGLLNQNKADQSMKLLEEALRLQPQSTNVNLAIIRAEIQLSHGYEALSILRQIPADELPADRRGLLEGEIFMSLEKWEDAKRLLTAVAVNKSESRRVHELLAQIYEHQKDWQRAAMEYRAANQATEE